MNKGDFRLYKSLVLIPPIVGRRRFQETQLPKLAQKVIWYKLMSFTCCWQTKEQLH